MAGSVTWGPFCWACAFKGCFKGGFNVSLGTDFDDVYEMAGLDHRILVRLSEPTGELEAFWASYLVPLQKYELLVPWWLENREEQLMDIPSA